MTLPICWGDLTLQQLRTVVEVLLMQLSPEERLTVLFCRLSGVKIMERREGTTRLKADDGSRFDMPDALLADCAERLRWIIDQAPDELPNPTKTDEYLRDMSFGDWFETDTHFRLYESDKDLSHFDTIVPKLYGDTHQVDKVDAEVLRMWWNMVMSRISARYPNVFSSSGGNGDGMADPFKNLQEMHLLLNDDRPQENERIDDSRLHDVLAALDSKIGKLKRQKAELERIRR